jgi:hypothetical protein
MANKLFSVLLVLFTLSCICAYGNEYCRSDNNAIFFTDSILLAEGKTEIITPIIYFDFMRDNPLIWFINKQYYDFDFNELFALCPNEVDFIGLNGDFIETALDLIKDDSIKVKLDRQGLASFAIQEPEGMVDLWVRPIHFQDAQINIKKDYIQLDKQKIPIPKDIFDNANRFQSWLKLARLDLNKGSHRIELKSKDGEKLDKITIYLIKPDRLQDGLSRALDIISDTAVNVGYLFTTESEFFVPETSYFSLKLELVPVDISKDALLFKIDDIIYTTDDFYLSENNYIYRGKNQVSLSKGFHTVAMYNSDVLEWLGVEQIITSFNESKDKIFFKASRINPTRWQIVVDFTAAGKWLIFNESFHPFWKAYIGIINSSEETDNKSAGLFKKSAIFSGFKVIGKMKELGVHRLANGYANSWYITPDIVKQLKRDRRSNSADKLLIILEYYPQRYLEFGIVVSILALFIVILFFAFRRNYELGGE